MLAVGSSVLTKKSSGVIASESPTHWAILGFAGTFEEGPLRVTSHKKGGKDVQPFLVPGAVTLSAMQDVYNAAMPHLQQKSAKAHAVLLSLLGQTKGTTPMAISKERAAAYKAAGDSALKVAKEQEAKKAAEKNPAPTKVAKPTPAKAAKPAKSEKPAAKPAKVAAEPSGKPGRTSAIKPEMKVKLLVAENPKRAGAAERFALYKDGMTVAKYLELGGTMADVRWDIKQQFISVA